VSDLPSKSQEVQEFVEMLTSATDRTGSLPEIDEVQHPLATKLPLMPESIGELAEDIKENKLHTSMVLHERKILEGRRRYLACKLACKLYGRQFTVSDFSLYESCSGDPELYVISVNVMRRHLPDDVRAALAAEHWERIKKKQGRKAGQEIRESQQGVEPEGDKILGNDENFFLEDNFLGKTEKTPAQQKQESRQRKKQVATAYGTTVGAMEEQTRLRKADQEKAEEVKTGKTTFREASQEVAEKTGKRARKPKPLVMEFKDGHTLGQVFHTMFSKGRKTLEVRVIGQGRAIVTLDADVKPVIGVSESEIVQIAAAQNPPISQLDATDMLDSCKATGKTYEDWGAALRNWRRRGWLLSQKLSAKPQRASQPQRTPQGRSTVKTVAEHNRAAAEQAQKMKASLERQQHLDGDGQWKH
jgi:hypothetical protein